VAGVANRQCSSRTPEKEVAGCEVWRSVSLFLNCPVHVGERATCAEGKEGEAVGRAGLGYHVTSSEGGQPPAHTSAIVRTSQNQEEASKDNQR
jgi:hypothetical protein